MRHNRKTVDTQSRDIYGPLAVVLKMGWHVMQCDMYAHTHTKQEHGNSSRGAYFFCA